MALSSSGRKLFAEVAGCIGVLVVGAYCLSHAQETKQLAATLLGLKLPASQAARAPAASTDTGQTGQTANSSGRRSVELTSQQNGHFFAEAEINGRPVTVMVDTGASMVALTYDDARRAGVVPRDSEFTQQANTANGLAKFASIEIDRISIGGVEVRRVQAAVMEEGKLDTTLLGMSFLSKLGSVAMRSGRLVLEE